MFVHLGGLAEWAASGEAFLLAELGFHLKNKFLFPSFLPSPEAQETYKESLGLERGLRKVQVDVASEFPSLALSEHPSLSLDHIWTVREVGMGVTRWVMPILSPMVHEKSSALEPGPGLEGCFLNPNYLLSFLPFGWGRNGRACYTDN